ncbi:MAG: hypothetical protein LCH52_02975 [Bacteroidetes bacterium]|nr:hypothetical protein [Bacteroidota bacterium]
MNTKNLTRSLFVVLAALFLTACSVSTEQLADQIKQDMENSPQFKEKGITVKEFTLTPKGGEKYEGLLKAIEPGGEAHYKVDVTFDGSKASWVLVEVLNKKPE